MEAKSATCLQCGDGTTPNADKTDCDTDGCKSTSNGRDYDLSKLERPDLMYGQILQKFPESDGHLYFLNMCTRQTSLNANLTCFDHNGDAIKSFACQRTNHGYAVNLGSTIGFGPSETRDGLGLTVTFSHGKHSSGCEKNGHPYRSTKIAMRCDPYAGIGQPETPADSPVEYPSHTCQYHFIWNSLYACPLCTESDHNIVKGDCNNETGTRTIMHVWNNPKLCHDGFQLPEEEVEECEVITANGARSAGSDLPWYKTPTFLISVIILGSIVLLATVAWSLIKYYKYRKLYEAYAQLDRDRGGGHDSFDTIPSSYDLELDDAPALPSVRL